MIPFVILWACAAPAGYLAGDVFSIIIEDEDNLTYPVAAAAIPPLGAVMSIYCILHAMRRRGEADE